MKTTSDFPEELTSQLETRIDTLEQNNSIDVAERQLPPLDLWCLLVLNIVVVSLMYWLAWGV